MSRRGASPAVVSVALIGCGDTGRALLRLLQTKQRELAGRYGLRFRLTGVATGSHGFAIDRSGIPPSRVLRRLEAGQALDGLHRGRPIGDTFELIRRRPAGVLVEISPLEPITAQPALDHIRFGLEQGMHVVTANKGPIALAYHELRRLSDSRGRWLKFEATVMDGTPLFNLVEHTLPASRIQGFRGILNSTSNLILTRMEGGSSFEEALDRARRLGITETDPRYDVEGWDAATKTAVLANVLMGARLRPRRIPRQGIVGIQTRELVTARRQGAALRLVASASRTGGTVTAHVALERLPLDDALARVSGTSSALALRTDTMGEVVLVETHPGVEQTAYGLLSDLVATARTRRRRR